MAPKLQFCRFHYAIRIKVVDVNTENLVLTIMFSCLEIPENVKKTEKITDSSRLFFVLIKLKVETVGYRNKTKTDVVFAFSLMSLHFL